MADWSRAVIVGASSGIGKQLACQLAAAGSQVVLVARREELIREIAAEINAGRAEPLASFVTADVRDAEQSTAAFDRITAEGDFDLIVYSSGIMPKGAGKGYPTDEDVKTIETNLTGAVVWLNAAAQYFLNRGRGTIVGIGSIAGDRGRRGNPVYNATKAALATYLESLRYRLAPAGIRVVTIKPGFVRTALIGDRRVIPPAVSAEEAARLILKAARRGPRVVYVPFWWRGMAIMVKFMPAPIMQRLPW